MPQVGDDVALDQVPDRCGYAYSPGWAREVTPAREVELESVQDVPAREVLNPDDLEHPIVIPPYVIPADPGTVPATWESVPPRARVLKLDLAPEDVLANPAPLVAELETQLQGVRDAWGCPEGALVMAAYRFEV